MGQLMREVRILLIVPLFLYLQDFENRIQVIDLKVYFSLGSKFLHVSKLV